MPMMEAVERVGVLRKPSHSITQCVVAIGFASGAILACVGHYTIDDEIMAEQ